MELAEAIRILEEYQAWRRFDGELADSPDMPNPKRVGVAIDVALNNLKL